MAKKDSKIPVDVILGTGSFGTGKTVGADCTADKQEVQKIIDEFKKRGLYEVDNARSYSDGTSEAFLAEMDYARQGLIMDTKIPAFSPGAQSAANVRASVASSLAALKTNKIHILYLHAPDRTTPFEETLEAVNEEYKKGHFEKFGISNYTVEEVEKIIQITKEKGYVQPTVYQGIYNVVTRKGEDELFPVLRKHKISFFAYSPLAGSFLVGNVAKSGFEKAEPGSRFDQSHILGQMYGAQFFKESLRNAVDKLSAAGAAHGVTLQEIALRWLAHHSQLSRAHGDALITGGRKLVNFQKTLDILEKGPLPAEVTKVVEDIWPLIKADSPAYHL